LEGLYFKDLAGGRGFQTYSGPIIGVLITQGLPPFFKGNNFSQVPQQGSPKHN